jgi:hypothetical protein
MPTKLCSALPVDSVRRLCSAGRRHCSPLLNIRVVLAPVELGPYNRHAGYHFAGQGAFILGNRHIVRLKDGSLR